MSNIKSTIIVVRVLYFEDMLSIRMLICIISKHCVTSRLRNFLLTTSFMLHNFGRHRRQARKIDSCSSSSISNSSNNNNNVSSSIQGLA